MAITRKKVVNFRSTTPSLRSHGVAASGHACLDQGDLDEESHG